MTLSPSYIYSYTLITNMWWLNANLIKFVVSILYMYYKLYKVKQEIILIRHIGVTWFSNLYVTTNKIFIFDITPIYTYTFN